jgi:inosine-uridine nucleoside N-ribohydrolase
MSEKIIIDTDPGIDDAFAILYASYSPQIELLGLTTVFGNVSVEQTTRNAGYLNTLLQTPVPVAKGAERPLQKGLLGYAEFVHGDDGLGNTGFQPPATFAPEALSAAEFIVEQVNKYPNEVTLVPIGPLTNIALALELDPTIASKAKSVVLMGGAVQEPGNVSPVAEANIWNDPHAAQKVFAASWHIAMVGLDVTHKVTMNDTHTSLIAKHSPTNGGFLHAIGDFYQKFYQTSRDFPGFAVHDPCAVVYVTHPEWFMVDNGQVDVLVDGIGVGQTIFAKQEMSYVSDYWKQRGNVSVPMMVNSEAVLDELITVLSNAP